LFSTTTGWPSSLAISSPTVRESVSPVPPAASGTTSLIGLLGYCASAGAAATANAAHSAARKRFIFPPGFLPATT
jgi:hypothetical protein